MPYGAIVIGTGAGGGMLALHRAKAGKNTLILERDPFIPQEKLNWDTQAVFLNNRYHTNETWQDNDGKDLYPRQAYYVSGQTKVYVAAILDNLYVVDASCFVSAGAVNPSLTIIANAVRVRSTAAATTQVSTAASVYAPCVHALQYAV